MLKNADLNKNHTIDYNEFKQMVNSYYIIILDLIYYDFIKIVNPQNNLNREKVSVLVKMLRNVTTTVASRSLNNYNQITSKYIKLIYYNYI